MQFFSSANKFWPNLTLNDILPGKACSHHLLDHIPVNKPEEGLNLSIAHFPIDLGIRADLVRVFRLGIAEFIVDDADPGGSDLHSVRT